MHKSIVNANIIMPTDTQMFYPQKKLDSELVLLHKSRVHNRFCEQCNFDAKLKKKRKTTSESIDFMPNIKLLTRLFSLNLN